MWKHCRSPFNGWFVWAIIPIKRTCFHIFLKHSFTCCNCVFFISFWFMLLFDIYIKNL
jgi:hypothetical protein